MVYPNPQIYHRLGAIFVHVPKTGGTSIEQALRDSPDQVVGGHTTAVGYRRAYPRQFASYFKFSVVRHPTTRFFSAYHYLRRRPVHPALTNAAIHRHGTFDSWFHALREDISLLEGIVHLYPQCRFLCDAEGRVLVDRIFHYEALDAAWVEICGRLGIEQRPLSRLNASPPGGDRMPLRREVLEWIQEEYAEDYALWGYDRAEVGTTPALIAE